MRYRVSDGKVAWRISEGEAVLLHADTSAYFGLNRVGTLLWQGLARRSQGPEDLADWLRDRCAGTPETVEADVAAFLDQLLAHDLLEASDGHQVAPGPTASGGEEPRPEGLGYEAPQLLPFGELEKLILSGE